MRSFSTLLVVVLPWLSGCSNENQASAHGSEPAFFAGAELARRDIAVGRLALKTYGLTSAPDAAFAALAKVDLGVDVLPSAGCALSGSQAREIDAYNQAMTREIEHRFGRGILARLRKQAAVTAATSRPASR